MNRELKEIWKSVEGYEGLYEISNLGNLYRLEYITNRGRKIKGKLMNQYLNYKGYIQVYLIKEGKKFTTTIHRLMAIAFIPNPDNKPQINHLNGIKNYNKLENFEWCDNSENQLHAFHTGLKKYPKGELNSNTSLTEELVNIIKQEYNSGGKIPELSKKYSIELQILRNIIYGRTWTHNTTSITKRDDRKGWSEEHTKNSLISKFINNNKVGMIVIGQYNENNEEITRFRSINKASIQTGIPRKSIEAVVNEKRFPNKNGTFWTMKKAGGFNWKKVEVNLEQFKQLI